jgi:hypothetical protein
VAGALAALCAPAAWGLGISVPPASVGALKPGTTATSLPEAVVISGLPLEAWTLRVEDPDGDGHMVRSGLCSLGTPSLLSPLHLSFANGLGSTVFDRPEYDLDSAANPVVAHGSAPDSFAVQFSQPVGGTEPLAAGCGYGLTIRYTVAAG